MARAFRRGRAGHVAAEPAPPPPPPPPPPDPELVAMAAGTFRFDGEPALSCTGFWTTAATAIRNRLVEARQAAELRDVLRQTRCGSDLAYYEFGTTYIWEHDAARAKPYLEQAIAVAKDKASPPLLVCRKNRTCGFAVSVEVEPALRMVNGVLGGLLEWNDAPAAAPAAPGAGATAGEQAMYLVTVVGRARLLAVRGTSCDPAQQLGRGYCIGEAIDQLREHADLRDTTVVTVDQPWQPGTWVSRKAGLNWDLFKVSRAGVGFRADREGSFATRTGTPLGCTPGMEADSGWVIVVDGGRLRAAEAARYLCDRPIDTRSGVAPVPTTLAQAMGPG